MRYCLRILAFAGAMLLATTLLVAAEGPQPPSVFDLPRLQAERAAGKTPPGAKDEAPPAPHEVKPAEIIDGKALVSEDNVAWNPKLGVLLAVFKLDPKTLADKPIAVGLGAAGDMLRRWQSEGTAAGNVGDLYDNHDAGHSKIDLASHPQLSQIEFDKPVKSRHLHTGVQLSFLYSTVTLGNSSTAVTGGPFWRCQARLALTHPTGPGVLYLQYLAGQLYVYPEHRDHDPGHNGADGKGYGDLLPANTPYLILSQGSSSSDRPFLSAVAATLAAFRPEVKKELAKTGLLMPTVQMIFRTCNRQVVRVGDYLAGVAHPTAFESRHLDVEKMVAMAHSIQPDTLPPMVQLKVLEEDQPVVGRDYFDAGPRERLFDTPCAIARVVKSTKYVRRMVVSAEESKDLRGRPLEYRWAVLRGDGEKIRINKLNEAGSKVELLVPYHPRRPVLPGSAMESNRVDIGAFVHNGAYYSAPAMVSFFYLDNETRSYDDAGRIVAVDYNDPATRGNYVDPILYSPKDWRDEYRYSPAGEPQGWTRIRADRREEFTAEGLRIDQRDEKGQPLKTRAVRYVLKPDSQGRPMLVSVDAD